MWGLLEVSLWVDECGELCFWGSDAAVGWEDVVRHPLPRLLDLVPVEGVVGDFEVGSSDLGNARLELVDEEVDGCDDGDDVVLLGGV